MSAHDCSTEPPIGPAEAARQIFGLSSDLAISAAHYAIGAPSGVTDMDHGLSACDWPCAPDAAVAADVAGLGRWR
jgi:hypothetical protein